VDPAEGRYVARQPIEEIVFCVWMVIVAENGQVRLDRTPDFICESLLAAKRSFQKCDDHLKPGVPVNIAVILGFPAKLFYGTQKLALHCVALAGFWN